MLGACFTELGEENHLKGVCYAISANERFGWALFFSFLKKKKKKKLMYLFEDPAKLFLQSRKMGDA